MAGVITCPNCNHQFAPTDAFKEEVQKELNAKAQEWQRKKEEEYRRKEQDLQMAITNIQKQLQEKDAEQAKQQRLLEQQFQQQLIAQQQQLKAEMEVQLRKSIAADFENQLKIAQQTAADKEEKLKEARQKELEFLQKEQALKNKEAELELQLQQRLLEETEKRTKEIRKIEEQRLQQKEQEFLLKLAEKEKQLEDQKKLAEEMRRKAEQGSMQLQGEIQELLLEDLLRNAFPVDIVAPVGKGVRGADCILTVRTPYGAEAGRIIFESKRTKDFGGDWIEKLKADMRSQAADIAVIVTQAMPKDMERFGEKDGVYICNFNEVRSLVTVLRNAILKINDLKRSQENRGDKITLLYDYLTSSEFSEQWKAIKEGFLAMRQSIINERAAMEKLWKAREKQLEKVLISAAHIKGSIEGIAGSDAVNLNLLDDAPEDILIDN
ncbi:MAG: DUF2130 domain-containing protein [Chitinophagaceae bacterium]